MSVRACVRPCVRVCVRASVRACVCYISFAHKLKRVCPKRSISSNTALLLLLSIQINHFVYRFDCEGGNNTTSFSVGLGLVLYRAHFRPRGGQFFELH